MRDELGRGPDGNRGDKVAAKTFSFEVESASQLFQEEGVVLLILRPEDIPVANRSWVLPINIQAIELVVAHKLNRAVDECLPAGGSQHHVREGSGPGPPTDR